MVIVANNKKLTELICTRLSHDIVGNIGAVSNAVELLEEGDMDFIEDIKSILKTSSQVLSARMKFFRLAFGLHNNSLDSAEIVENASRAYLETVGSRNYPISLDFSVSTAQNMRLAMLGIMVIADMLVHGGRIIVMEKEGKLRVTASGDKPLPQDKMSRLKEILAGEFPEDDARFAPLACLLAELGAKNRKIYFSGTDFPDFVFE